VSDENAGAPPEASAESKTEAVPDPGASPAAGGVAAAPHASKTKPDRSSWYWGLGVALLVVLELYFYGKNGVFQVCVAKDGFHDWNLIGQQRNDANRWKFPYCEERKNLGLRSEFDDLAREAVKASCRRATLMHFKGEENACIAMEKGWRRKVITRQVMPWEKQFYRRLFWLEQR